MHGARTHIPGACLLSRAAVQYHIYVYHAAVPLWVDYVPCCTGIKLDYVGRGSHVSYVQKLVQCTGLGIILGGMPDARRWYPP